MGILDALNSTDPSQQAQLALAAHLLGARSVKGERGGFGQALGGGLLAYQQAMEQGRGNEMKRKMQQLQMDAAEREAKANLPPSADDMAKFTGMMTGTPERMDVAGNPNAYMPPTPAQPANPMGAYGFAMGSQNPSMQKIGVQGMHQFPQLEATRMEKEDNRTWRTQESELSRKAREKEITDKLAQDERLALWRSEDKVDADVRNFENQKTLKKFGASLASGMRQPEAPVAVRGPDGNPIYVSRADAIGKSPAEKPAAVKPLGNKELTQLQEARENAASLDALNTTFKPEFGNKGVFGLGADFQMGASANIGADKNAVDWWKNYKKQAELVERHAMFGASLTSNEQASWRSADVAPSTDQAVIKKNLATRAALTKKVLANTKADLIDAGHGEGRISSIADRGGAGAELKPGAKPGGAKFLGFE